MQYSLLRLRRTISTTVKFFQEVAFDWVKLCRDKVV